MILALAIGAGVTGNRVARAQQIGFKNMMAETTRNIADFLWEVKRCVF